MREEATQCRCGLSVDEKGSVLARFSQKIQFLLGGSALSLSIVIEPTRELQSLVSSSSDALSRFFTCRFAWNENDFCDIFRNIQTQFVETERQRIFSPAVLSLVSDGGMVARQGEKPMPPVKNSGLQIFSGCHPWHVRSSSHTLDTVLTTDCETPTQTFQLAIGIDLAHVDGWHVMRWIHPVRNFVENIENEIPGLNSYL